MKYDERACKFSMDTGCVELRLQDGRKIVIVLQVFWKFMCSYTILRDFVDR